MAAGWLDEYTGAYLVNENPKIPVLYTLPKVHKDLSGGILVSAHGGILEPLAKYVDHYCKSSIEDIPTCLKDMQDFLSKIHGLFLPNFPVNFTTIDVKNLFTIIPHNVGTEAIWIWLSECKKQHGPPIEFLVECLEFLLNHNYFRLEFFFLHTTQGDSDGISHGASLC
ncbi:Hypothetical predicted protein [Pelobates cultripes]|uniref:Uncharacterized protein n=1 Tax=Pelobates cultripes TaxID=61616 RepID=A0AAD1R5Q0_PELCU|nr:Hypothetical predicted protein [Pelobates cultripes]